MWFTIPNLICYFRVALAFIAFYDFYNYHDAIRFFILTIIVVALDGLDGIVARKLNQTSTLGAKIDIAADRITELSYWLFFAYIEVAPIWIFCFFLVRGFLVDYLTRKQEKPLGKSFLRSSRFMRAFYGALKLLSFLLLIILPKHLITEIIVYLTVLVCFLRAYPVLYSSLWR
jgi:CDP-diacylglycerol--glycerol-3-phosphate 3-phosphatidyltransferase